MGTLRLCLLALCACNAGELSEMRSRAESAEQQVRSAQANLAQVTTRAQSCTSANDELTEETKRLTEKNNRLTQENQKLAQENQKLKETAQAYLGEAAELMKANTDQADHAAISKLKELLARFPGDPATATARSQIAECTLRIETRATQLRAAQADIRRAIAACARYHAAAREVEAEPLVFNFFNQVDMNSLMQRSRRREALDEKAKAAKDEATELLKAAQDPDGSLTKAVADCDKSDQD